ncbi:outer membrane protein assembly factor BamE [Hoeflea poritis]|uniref:Outer membrane protein assembly factor BamE n=1 Tax=Hoeflea poritis TaxID=2993659 RepID=A0ABT4VVZ5_9HYPH|nr:outer membrane protein assembly factor BamE [Hoeflea poritis]MDA4848814.1 outer membrane protein assembly factor BamE [Hoeflea poritis]
MIAGTTTLLLSAAFLAGCNSTSEVFTQGYVVDEQTLELVPPGSSKEQVLLSLGTPTTKGDYGQEAFYYISQKRVRSAMFMKPRLVEQSILAVYFDDEETVSNIANYTMQDGKVFDTIRRTTPTGGKEETFLSRALSNVSSSGQSRAQDILTGGNSGL